MALTKVTYSMVDGAPINVLDLGAVGDGVADDTTALQAALTLAETTATPIYIPTGVYRVTSGLVYSDTAYGKGLQLYGDGMYQSVIKMDANSQIVFTIKHASGGGGENYTSHGNVSNIGFTQFGGRTGVTGLRISNCWYYTFENIDVSNLSSVGFEAYSVTPASDVDIVALCLFKGIRCKNNGGSGFRVNAASASIAITQSRFEFCDFSGNDVDGITLSNFDGVEFNKCIMTANGTASVGNGITVADNGIANRNLVLRGCETGNGNKRSGLQLENMLGVLSEQNRWIQNDGEAGQYLIEFVSGSTIQNFTDKNSYIVVGNAITPLTAYEGQGAALSNVRIENPFFALFSTANKTKYAFTSPQDLVIVENQVSKGTALGYNRAINPVSYAPDAFEYKHHVVQLQAISSTTISAPLNSSGGREIDLVVWNSSGGVITVTFDPVFQVGGYTDPVDGFRATARFVYDPLNASWVQVGAWATNVPG